MRLFWCDKQTGWVAIWFLIAILCFGRPVALGQIIDARSESQVVRLEPGQDGSPAKARVLTVEMGDARQPVFDPSFELSAWEGECRLRVNLSNAINPMASAQRVVGSRNSQPMTRLVTPECNHELYVREDGNFEWGLTFSGIPPTNIFSYQIDASGLAFYYQAELTASEIAAGHHRPDSVVGSYAVYHASGRGNSQFGQYGTGKAFHIFRPKAWDSSGDTVWVDLNIDTVVGSLTLVVDRDWLLNAKYPVVIDPTLGYTSIGGSSIASSYEEWNLFNRKEATTASGTVDTIAVYLGENCTIAEEGCLLVFSNDNGSWRPDTMMAAETMPSFSGTGWYKATPSSVNFAAGDTLWPGCNINCLQSSRWNLYYDSGTANDIVKRDNDHVVCGTVGESFVQSSFTAYSIFSAYVAVTYDGDASGARRSRLLKD